MDQLEWKKKVIGFLGKYRYAAIVLLIGIVLMLLPSYVNSGRTETVITNKEESILTIEEKLSRILSEVKGAGEVRVMLTLASGEETLYQTNEDYSIGDNTNTKRSDTVTVTDAQRNETGLIRQQNPPKYLGAIIVCNGADSPEVRLAVVEAVSKVTGLGADDISVLKMK